MTTEPPAVLNMWTVYRQPRDYPNGYVARRFEVDSKLGPVATSNVHVGDTLEAVRAKLPPGLYRLPRDDRDAPSVVETWL
jgi:hypothetical protein